MSALVRNILEIGFGMLYLIGLIFNTLYTFRHGDEFYGSFARGAWLVPARQMILKIVIPHARIFTGLLIAFQVLEALSILSRGNFLALGLLAGGMFCIIAAFVSNTTGAIANLILAGAQVFLVFTR
jgi:hypothetical protein